MGNESPDGRPSPDWRRKPIRLQGFDYSDPNYVYSVSLCARQPLQPYSDKSLAGMVVEALLFRAGENHWRVYAYCLMPDHLHLALSPVVGKGSLPSLIQGFKSYTTRMAWKLGRQGILWQRSYYDHIARREEDVTAICQYILSNPVRKGLVSDPAKWPWSGMPHPVPG
ncbi:MAG: transposase, partial [Dehalococcoidia bacterium]|nr:transposase [Dehalococcoidia bacterium]